MARHVLQAGALPESHHVAKAIYIGSVELLQEIHQYAVLDPDKATNGQCDSISPSLLAALKSRACGDDMIRHIIAGQCPAYNSDVHCS